MQPDTDPAEWRRRASLAEDSLAPRLVGLDDASAIGLDELDAGEDARDAAAFCRRLVFDQPDDVAGVVIGAGDVVAAHVPNQRFDVLGRTVLFLVRRFTAFGELDDLDAAAELHDLTIALGQHVWDHPDCVVLGRAAAELYGATGEEAFLATAERSADVVCEAQQADGSIGDLSRSFRAARLLREMADLVEDRRAARIDPEPESTGGGGDGGG